jgi:hypothetical protein
MKLLLRLQRKFIKVIRNYQNNFFLFPLSRRVLCRDYGGDDPEAGTGFAEGRPLKRRGLPSALPSCLLRSVGASLRVLFLVGNIALYYRDILWALSLLSQYSVLRRVSHFLVRTRRDRPRVGLTLHFRRTGLFGLLLPLLSRCWLKMCHPERSRTGDLAKKRIRHSLDGCY